MVKSISNTSAIIALILFVRPKSPLYQCTNFEVIITLLYNLFWLSAQFTPEDGPLPAEFLFHDNKNYYELVGKATESETKREFNEIFGVDEIFFSDKVVFTQLIKQTNPEKETIQVELSYQVCKENCISETKYFEFNLKTLQAKEIEAADIVNEKTTTTDANSTIEKQPESKESDSSLYMIFFIAFLYGFAALLIPCVFPMIPMTVSFFTKQSKNKAKGIKNAIISGISIYVFLGTQCMV